MKAWVIILIVIVVAGIVGLLVYNANKKTTVAKIPTKKPVPQPSWTYADFISNGYTADEYKQFVAAAPAAANLELSMAQDVASWF